ncbi:MAG: phenylalanine--tRNA ligase subunit beta [Solirubrobacteraceae bacterium]
MRVPLSWLRKYCDSGLDAHELAERLAMTGTEVERVEHHGVSALDHFVVGKVREHRRHPDADRLSVCMVDLGAGELSQIVCGASNVAAGQTVAVATPGAVMPDGTMLRKAKLRGLESRGMILAEDEVGIGTEHGGIMVLAGKHAAGTPLSSVLPISTDVLVLEITPNRPDCLGIYGVAREVHAATGAPLQPPPWADDVGMEGALAGIEIAVEDQELCPRFTARIFEFVTVGPSPLWLKARLMAAGQRPIANVVDITNYVMLLTGQPMHAFDLDRIAGGRLNVRRAHPGEQVQTLDGQVRVLDEQMLLIEDAAGPTSIAGVMGGARSEVHDGTVRVLSEVASWNGANIHRTSLELGLRSEASSRFEKGLAPEQAMQAQALATRLMIELCGARVRGGTIDIGGPGPAPITIRLRERRLAAILGTTIPRARCRAILESLEFAVEDADDGLDDANDGLDVTVPAFRRADITREADLIEEVARLNGLQEIPATLPATRRYAAAALAAGVDGAPAGGARGAGMDGAPAGGAHGAGEDGAPAGGAHGASAQGRLTPRQQLRRRAADVLAAQGLHEIVGWSFAGAQDQARLRLPRDTAVSLANPMSAEQSRLRTTLIGSLLDVAQRNRSRGAGALRLFEAGAVYHPSGDGELPREPHHVGALMIGPVRPATWRSGEPPAADFFAAKGMLTALLDTLSVPWEVRAGVEPFLHPGRAAAILADGVSAGWLGELHPSVAAQWDIEQTAAGFELDLDALGEPSQHPYVDLTSFPAVREDLAVVIGEQVSAADVLAVIDAAGAPLLSRCEVFDVYHDEAKLGAGNTSLALALSYRAPDRTLTDAEVARQREAIIAALARELGGRIRAS